MHGEGEFDPGALLSLAGWGERLSWRSGKPEQKD